MTLPLIPGPYTELVPQVRALRDAVETSIVGGDVYDPRDYGAVGNNSTDDTSAVQDMFDDVPNYARVLIPRNFAMKITSTLLFENKWGVRVAGEGSLGNAAGISAGAPCFVWHGANAGIMMDIRRSRECEFANFLMDMNGVGGGSNGADTAVWLEQQYGAGSICTSNIFEHVSFNGNSARTTVVVVDIGDSSGQNNEFHEFNKCAFYGGTGGGTGTIVSLRHANVKGIKFHDSNLSYAAVGIKVVQGSFQCLGNVGTALDIMYLVQSPFDPVTVQGDVYELIRQVLVVPDESAAPFVAIGCQWNGNGTGGTSTYPVIDDSGYLSGSDGGIDIVLIGCQMDGFAASPTDIFKGGSNYSLTTFLTQIEGVTRRVLEKNYSTFRFASINTNDNPSVLSAFNTNSEGGGHEFITTSGHRRRGLSIQGDYHPNFKLAATNSLYLCDEVVEIAGLHNVAEVTATVVGTTGSTNYSFFVIPLDAAGHRTRSGSRNNFIQNANATLSASNRIELTWTAVAGAATYDVVNTGTASTFPGQLVVNTAATSYSVVANPTAPNTYEMPPFNETGRSIFRGPMIHHSEVTFAANDATPDVFTANDFVTANSSGTSITTFDNGTAGQVIRVRVNDANTTLVNGSGLLNRTAANIVAVNGLIYSYIRRGSSWYEL